MAKYKYTVCIQDRLGEFTESETFDDPVAAREYADRLAANGCKVTINPRKVRGS